MYSHISSILDLEAQCDQDGWQNDLAHLVSEIFTHNHEACKHVRSEVLSQIIGLVSKHLIQMPSMLLTLAAVTRVEELSLPIKRNQSFIMKLLLQHRTTIVHAGFMGATSNNAS